MDMVEINERGLTDSQYQNKDERERDLGSREERKQEIKMAPVLPDL